MNATTALPASYGQLASFEPARSWKFVLGAVVVGIVLLLAAGWLLVRFVDVARPEALDGMRFRELLAPTSAGASIQIPLPLIRDLVIALILVLINHELVHGVFFAWFSGKRPKFGLQGIFPYVAAPEGVYFSRNAFIVVGIAPLVVLTALGLPLIAILPAGFAPIILFFLAFNAAGSAGDLLMIGWLLPQPAVVMVEDNEVGFAIYGPENSPNAVTIQVAATSEADLADLKRLWNDGRVMQWVGFPDGLGYDTAAMRAWFERLQGAPQRHHFVVRDSEGQFCGELYYAVDEARRRASLDIKLLPEAQGRGVATQALRRLIDHVFAAEPAVDAAWTEPSGDNRAAQRLYARCGLKPTDRPADLHPAESYWEIRRPDRPHGHEHDPLLSG